MARGAQRAVSTPDYEMITDQAAFQAVVDELLDQPRMALDTEFHRERTYFPRLALLQLAWPGRLVLIDPLEVDLEPLAAVLESECLAVLHAASQDLEVLEHVCGTVPKHLYDTQLAAGFLGMTSPSLTSLLASVIGIQLPKGDRLTDWLRRPLTENQLSYAASDVEYLLEVHDLQVADLTKRGRLEWAESECAELRDRVRGQRNPEEAFRRIKEARQLKGDALVAARELAAWRERRAAEVDQPVRFVLSDLAIVAIAQRRPESPGDLKKLRGVDERHVKGKIGEEVLAAVAAAKGKPPVKKVSGPRADLARELRPAVGLVSAWISQLAKNNEIEASLLATRADLEAFLRGDADARLGSGWRNELAGEFVRAVVEGRAALAFDGKGGLLLEARSYEPLADET